MALVQSSCNTSLSSVHLAVVVNVTPVPVRCLVAHSGSHCYLIRWRAVTERRDLPFSVVESKGPKQEAIKTHGTPQRPLHSFISVSDSGMLEFGLASLVLHELTFG
jgi:hypothetical protein